MTTAGFKKFWKFIPKSGDLKAVWMPVGSGVSEAEGPEPHPLLISQDRQTPAQWPLFQDNLGKPAPERLN